MDILKHINDQHQVGNLMLYQGNSKDKSTSKNHHNILQNTDLHIVGYSDQRTVFMSRDISKHKFLYLDLHTTQQGIVKHIDQ